MGLEKINKLKKEMGITTDELSEKSGVPVGTLNKILSGQTKDPKLETLKSIARVLGCTLDAFDDSEEKEEYSVSEKNIIEKYRYLDSHGQRIVNAVLDIEYERCSENERRITEFRQYENIAARGGSKHLEKDELNTLMEIFNDLSKK